MYDAVGGRLIAQGEMGDLSNDSVWIDLLNPAENEDKAIEQVLGIEVPTLSEMREIEAWRPTLCWVASNSADILCTTFSLRYRHHELDDAFPEHGQGRHGRELLSSDDSRNG
jgi:hypothetical protein